MKFMILNHILKKFIMVEFYILMLDTQETLKKILLKLFDLFLKRGGHFEKQNVQSISFTSDNKPVIKTDFKFYTFDKAVIACGAFSKKNNRSS